MEKENTFVRIENKLQHMRTELDEFRLQLALGKAEVIDKFEEVKHTFKDYVNSFDEKIAQFRNKSEVPYLKIRQKIDELRVQLALGKAEGKDAFEKQRKIISEQLQELENLIQNEDLGEELEIALKEEMEKFRIKMEMLRVKVTLGKYEFKDNWDRNKNEFNNKIAEWRKKTEDIANRGKIKINLFGTEVAEAFYHLKKAFGIEN